MLRYTYLLLCNDKEETAKTSGNLTAWEEQRRCS